MRCQQKYEDRHNRTWKCGEEIVETVDGDYFCPVCDEDELAEYEWDAESDLYRLKDADAGERAA